MQQLIPDMLRDRILQLADFQLLNGDLSFTSLINTFRSSQQGMFSKIATSVLLSTRLKNNCEGLIFFSNFAGKR